MQILCAPDSFKESLSAVDAAAAMARGVQQAGGQAMLCPIADGGEGTVEAMLQATHGQWRTTQVVGPLGTPIDAAWGWIPATADQPCTAVIEMAQACGLALVPHDQRDPTRTTTFGVGELIKAALDAGAKHLVLGIGGSATTDAGCGAAQALGVQFYEAHDALITTPITGGMLDRVTRIELASCDARLREVTLYIACDVTNPLLGVHGAAAVYGPQKGASPEQVELLDANLAHIADLLEAALKQTYRDMPGAGAAGGFGMAAVAMFGGTMRSGAELVLEAVGFDRLVRDCDLCLTGEGQLDGQSLSGKAIMTVMQAAKKHHVPTVALVGHAVDADKAIAAGLADYCVIGEGLSKAESITRAAELLEKAANRVVQQHRAV